MGLAVSSQPPWDPPTLSMSKDLMSLWDYPSEATAGPDSSFLQPCSAWTWAPLSQAHIPTRLWPDRCLMPGGGTVPVPPPAQLLAGWWDSGDRNEPAVHVCKLSPASLLLKLIFMYEKKSTWSIGLLTQFGDRCLGLQKFLLWTKYLIYNAWMLHFIY